MMSASVQGDAGTSSAGLKTTQLPNASAGAIFQAGIASGKFHGVIAATTPSGSRVISTSMPGRVESTSRRRAAAASPAKNLKMAPARAGFADAVRERLALFAREQPSELVLPRQDFGPGAIQDVEPFLRRRPRPLLEGRPRGRRSPARRRTEARANSPTTSVRLDGLMSVVRSVESIFWPSIRFGNVVACSTHEAAVDRCARCRTGCRPSRRNPSRPRPASAPR